MRHILIAFIIASTVMSVLAAGVVIGRFTHNCTEEVYHVQNSWVY